MEHFRSIGLIGRLGSGRVVDTLRRLKRFLLERGHTVILEDAVADLLPGHQLQVCSRQNMGDLCDLVIVVGGDGSLLGAARALCQSNVPVLGVNRGGLGFLTDIAPDELEQGVGDVLEGKYMAESRFLLDAIVCRNDEELGSISALNEVVLHPGKSARMIEFELFVDGQFVYSLKSDGMIVATPTGSTAYSLSAGGPIMHPKLDAMVLVPMYPHTLSSRPMVVEGNSEIRITISRNNEIYPQVSCDGQEHIACAPGDIVIIRKKAQKLRLIHPLNHNFYAICRSKLGWSSRLTK